MCTYKCRSIFKQLTRLYKVLLFWFYRYVNMLCMYCKTNLHPTPRGNCHRDIARFASIDRLRRAIGSWIIVYLHATVAITYCCFDLQMTVYRLSHLFSVVWERQHISMGRVTARAVDNQVAIDLAWLHSCYNIWSNCPGDMQTKIDQK